MPDSGSGSGSGSLRDLTPFFILLLLTSTLGPLLFGYHLAELNAPQEVINCNRERIDAVPPKPDAGLPQCIPMYPLQFGIVSSFFTLGGLLGALAAGPLTARQGRLRTMLITGVFAVVGPVLEAVASNIEMLTAGRLLSGVGAGAATVVVPIYISEIAPPRQKGFFGTFTQVMINVGILLAQLLGLFLSRGQLWRIILGVAGAIALAQLVVLFFIGQESPKWLAQNGKPAPAKKILRKLRGHKVNIDEEVSGWGLQSERDIDDEEETLLTNDDHMHHHPAASTHESSSRPSKTPPVSVFAVLRHPHYAPAVVAVATIMLAQQLCGINSIVMYGVGLLSELLSAKSALLNVAVSALNVLVTIASATLIERVGRKSCLIASIAGMGLSALLLALAIMFALQALSAVAVVAFVASFGLGLGPIPFLLSSELVNAEAVGATQSWALAANWIATFVVAQFFPIVNARLGKGQVYFIFAAFALAFAIFVAVWVPETKGKRDADEVWGRSKGVERED